MYCVKIKVPEATTVTSICAYLYGGVTLTANQCKAALYDGSKALLGTTADQSGNWGGTGGYQEMAISGGPVAISAGYAYAAFWFNGTTGPQVCALLSGTPCNFGLSAANSRWATADTGRTTTAPATLGAFTAWNLAMFAALK